MNGEETFVEIRISPRQAEELVDRLINDAGFRERLAQNPNAELSQYGISIPQALIPERVELPSSDELRRARDELADYEYMPKPYIWWALISLAWSRPRS